MNQYQSQPHSSTDQIPHPATHQHVTSYSGGISNNQLPQNMYDNSQQQTTPTAFQQPVYNTSNAVNYDHNSNTVKHPQKDFSAADTANIHSSQQDIYGSAGGQQLKSSERSSSVGSDLAALSCHTGSNQSVNQLNTQQQQQCQVITEESSQAQQITQSAASGE